MDGEEATVVLGGTDRTMPLLARPAAPLRVVAAAVLQPRPPVPVAPLAAVVPPRPPAPRRASPSAVRLVCWEVAVLAVVSSVPHPGPVLAATVAGAAVLIGLTGVRVRGRWGYQLTGDALRFLTRSHGHDLPEPTGLALLGLLGATPRTLGTGEHEVFAISHPAGLTAVLYPRVLAPEATASFPPPESLLPAGEDVGVRVVFHLGAMPGAPVQVWVAVQAVRTMDTLLDEELDLVLHNGIRRVQRALVRVGVVADPLAEDEALATVTALAHVSGGRGAVREDWGFWRAGAVSQACFTIDGWDPAGGLIPAVLSRPDGVAVTLAVSARPGATRAVLRLAATADPAVDYTAGRLAMAGLVLNRLDGNQFAGVAATLPIGGFGR